MEFLLNWLTQGVIVAMAAAAGLLVIPPSRTQARYGFLWAAYLLVLALPAIAPVLAVAIAVPAVDLAPISPGPVVRMPAAWWTSPGVAIGLWLIWSAIHAIQLIVGAVAVHGATRHCHECPRDLLARLPHWPHVNAAGRPTRVVLSNRVRLAAVLGCGSPVIALAPGLVQQLSAADLDRVLLHEWAHVQRRDDVAQLVQRLVRMIVGWHPAARWLERQLEFEREVACDEVAVGATGSAKAYAACLAALAALPQAPVRSLPALGAVSPSRLRRRLVRILAAPCAAATRPWRAVAICSGAGLAAFALVVGHVHVVAFPVTPAAVSTAQPADAGAAATDVRATSRPAGRTASVSRATPPGSQRSRGPVRPASSEDEASRDAGIAPAIEEPSPLPAASMPLQSLDAPLDLRISEAVAASSTEAPVDLINETPSVALTASAQPRAAETTPAPWTQAADAGVAIGRAWRGAGTATGGFFTRLGKKIGGSF